jgi:antitoxin component YwqK of YwqJK toxin-antitoxin module
MIKSTVTFLMIITSTLFFAQINSIKRGPCFEKSAERLGKKYVEWECKDGDGILDCNESLESDPGSNLVLTRDSGNAYTGDCETCHINGLRQRLVHFTKGKVDGIDITYYQSGCPQVVRNHIEGVENGEWTFYNDTSGLVAWHINYKNGEKHGQSIFFRQYKVGMDKFKIEIDNVDRFIEYAVYENDTVKIENYANGLLDGLKMDFYSDSKVKTEINYKAGLFDGAYLEYDSEGNVLQERFYIEGKKEGDWKYYYNDGSLLKTETWKADVKDAVFKNFYIQGHIQSLETYKNGMKHGEFMERFPDDKIKRQAEYKKDVLIEDHVFDKYGNEIETFGADKPNKNAEDDEVPTSKSKKWWQFWKKG